MKSVIKDMIYAKLSDKKTVTEVAVLQVWESKEWYGYWIIVGVFATKALAEQEASLRGYTRWSVSEFAVMGGE